MRWAYSAAWSGMTRSTEPATAVMLSDFRMSRRVGMGFSLVANSSGDVCVRSCRPFGTCFRSCLLTRHLRAGLLYVVPSGLEPSTAESQTSFLSLVEQILGRAPGQRHDGERRILVGVGDEAGSIGHEQILNIVSLAVLIQHRGSGMLSHANRAHFVDDDAAIGNAVGILPTGVSVGQVSAARSFHDGTVSFLHVARHFDFVVAPFPVKAEDRNAPLVDYVRIDFAIAVFVGNHLATTRETDVGAIFFPAFLFEGDTVAFIVVAQVVPVAHAGHAAPAAELGVVPAQDFVLAVKLPPGQVHVRSANALVVVRRHFFEVGKITSAVAADGVDQVAADNSRGIGQAIGKKRGLGIQQQPRRLAGASRYHESARVDPLLAAGSFIDVGNSRDLAILADHKFPRHSAGDHGEAAGLLRRWNHHLAGTEIGSADAPAPALRAIVTSSSAIVRLSENSQPRGDACNVQLVAGLLDDSFGAAWLGRRQEDAVGGTGNILFAPEDADVRLDLVVVRSNVVVSERPVVAHAVVRADFEVNGSKAQGNASPVIGAPAHDARAKPAEGGTGSRDVGLALDFPRAVRRHEFIAYPFASSSTNAGASVR